VAIKVHVILRSFAVLTWMLGIIKLVWHVILWNNTKKMWQFEFCYHVIYASVVHSISSSRAMWRTYAPTFNKWHKKKKKKMVTFHILTDGAMRGCELTSLVIYINDKIPNVRERNVTIRSDIWITNIRSLGFQNIREWVTLWRLILRRLGCNIR